jgi:hypothetical protein
MGIDVEVYVETTPEFADAGGLDYPHFGFEGVEEARFGPDGATHRLLSGMRYYGPHYERGPWPQICAALMDLMQEPEVKRVWYFGDSWEGGAPLTIDEVLEISRHYMTHGERPYRDPAYRAAMIEAATNPAP